MENDNLPVSRTCTRCSPKEHLPASAFYTVRRNGRVSLSSLCKSCISKNSQYNYTLKKQDSNYIEASRKASREYYAKCKETPEGRKEYTEVSNKWIKDKKNRDKLNASRRRRYAKKVDRPLKKTGRPIKKKIEVSDPTHGPLTSGTVTIYDPQSPF